MACCFILGHSLPARAQSNAELAEFERLVSQAQEAYDAGDFEGALEAFKDAEAIYAHPMISARIVESRVQLGDCTRAEDRLETLRARTTATEGIEAIEEAVAQCRPMGRLKVDCQPPTLELSLDAKSIACGEEVTVAPGEYELLGRAEGYRDGGDRVRIAQGDLTHVELGLETAEVMPVPPLPSAGESSLLPVVGWSAVGGGAVLVVAAVWVDSGSTDRQLELRKASEASDFERVQVLEDEAASMRSLSTGLLIGGALLAAGGTGVLLYDAFVEKEDAPTRVAVGVVAHVNRVSLTMSW